MTTRRCPPALYTGQTIGIAAPASGNWEQSTLEQSLDALRRWGFGVKLASVLTGERRGYLAGSDEARAESLNALIRDPEVAAIICLRGGYGSLRLLDRIDYAAMRDTPKIFLGFSDITALHVAFAQRSGVVTFHGPTLFGLAPPGGHAFNQEHCWKALMVPEPLGTLPADPSNPYVWTIGEGRGEGDLVGGCLTLLCATLGTPYEIDTAGKILVIEDVGCAPYQIDMMFTQLTLAGKLQAAAGIVIGRAADIEPDTRRGYHPSLSLDDVLQDHLAGLGIPVLYGLAIGHHGYQVTLPLGARARVDSADRSLTVLTAGTTP